MRKQYQMTRPQIARFMESVMLRGTSIPAWKAIAKELRVDYNSMVSDYDKIGSFTAEELPCATAKEIDHD